MNSRRLSSEELAAIQSRLTGASGGPWRAEEDQVFAKDEVLADICCGAIDQAMADAIFVASSRDDIERLLHEVRALKAELAQLR